MIQRQPIIYRQPSLQVICDDCVKGMQPFPDAYFDSIVTDPPAGISFMGAAWDKDKGGRDEWIKWLTGAMKQCLRVLKPGGHMVVWALPRTSHWTATAIEDAGFHVRDIIMHVFSTGFPKSRNISRAFDAKERDYWSNISKALDNLQEEDIFEAWKKYSNIAKLAGIVFLKNKTKVGGSMGKNDSVLKPVQLSISPGKLNANAIIADLNSNDGQHMSEESTLFVQEDAEANMEQLIALVWCAGTWYTGLEVYSEDSSGFTAQRDVEKLESCPGKKVKGRIQAVEVLKTVLGEELSLKQETTVALCAALTNDLKLITLSESKIFQDLGTKSQMDFVSATTVTITESMAVNLISSMVDTLRSEAARRSKANVIAIQKRSDWNWNPWSTKAGMDEEQTKNKPKTIDKEITAPTTDEAKEWAGWGSGLAPAAEHWILARKPFKGAIHENVLEYGVGGINIDGCRVPLVGGEELGRALTVPSDKGKDAFDNAWKKGRWPPDVVLSHHPSCVVVGQRVIAPKEKETLALPGFGILEAEKKDDGVVDMWACVEGCPVRIMDEQYGRNPDMVDGGSRIFPRFSYCPKPSPAERQVGMPKGMENTHITLKPVALMRWLVRLITPPAGKILDPFLGSGTTGMACAYESFQFVGIDQSEEFVEIARLRIAHAWKEGLLLGGGG